MTRPLPPVLFYFAEPRALTSDEIAMIRDELRVFAEREGVSATAVRLLMGGRDNATIEAIWPTTVDVPVAA